MRNTWLILCRAELFGEAIVCSDTDVEENCLLVADIDFLFLDLIPQVRRERFYFLFTFRLPSSRDFIAFFFTQNSCVFPKVP